MFPSHDRRDVDIDTAYRPVWGLDVARFGDNKSALAKRQRNALLEPVKTWRKRDTMFIAGAVLDEYENTPVSLLPSEILVDVIGVGAGVLDRLRELGLPARGINVGEQASGKERFMRLRDELWWRCREWFENLDCKIPDSEECLSLIGQLTSVGYDLTSASKVKVWGKEDMKLKGMDSPDEADAFILTIAG